MGCPRKGLTTQTHECEVPKVMVDFGSEQGLSIFETGGVDHLRRGFQKSENAAPGQKMPFVNGYYEKIRAISL